MAFKFQFQSILDLKVRLEDAKKNEYGRVIALLNEEKEILNGYKKEMLDLQENIKGKISAGFTVTEIITMNQYIVIIDNKIQRQNKKIEELKGLVEKKRLELVQAAKEKKMFETLKEKKFEEYREAMNRREQQDIDELITFRNRKKD